ncbi:MAG: AtpZ/AtpI family protein [Alphaproteobacteria bacterium]|nr:AtpZ/AtpI family protein [Alphaproteobacteria bacterium]
MSESDKPGALQDLDARLRRLKAQEHPPERAGSPASRSGYGFAMRLGVEIVAALIVGAGIGILLDQWLGTGPWLLIAFFVLGAAAGMMNVYRVVRGIGGAVGYRAGGSGPDQGQRSGGPGGTKPAGRRPPDDDEDA